MNLEDLKILRQYFLTNSEEIKRNFRSVAPGMLLKYLSILQDGFLRNQDLKITVETIDAKNLLPEIKKLQIDYYYSLASLYNKGERNEEIEILLKNNNEIFKTVLDEYDSQIFEREVEQAFILNERESLKKKFIDLDNANDISPSEMEDAFMQIERERLKEHFKEIDSSINDETIQHDYMVAEPSDNYNYGSKETDISASTSVIKFNWKKLAIAASVFGLVLISTILIINNNKSAKEIAKNGNNKGAIINKVDSNLPNKDFENKAKELLANNKLKYKEVQIRLLKSESFGFSEREEKIIIRFFDIKERIAELEKITKTPVGAGGDHSYEIAIKDQIDSLQLLKNKYTFDGKTIALYIANINKVESFKLKDKYFIKIDGKVYSVIKSLKPTPFNKVTDKNVLEKIDEIDFKQNN